MPRKAWTLGGVALMVAGIALFLSGHHETSIAVQTSDPRLASGVYWMPPHRLLALALFLVGLIVLVAATAYAAGVRRGRSATS